jgi:signal transduction histidine kinase
VLVSAEFSEDDLTICVEDSGIGIEASDIPDLTKPFTQVSSTQAYISAEGTGLGLSIVASLVDLHHGQMEITSQVGKGTRVKVILPGVLRTASRQNVG